MRSFIVLLVVALLVGCSSTIKLPSSLKAPSPTLLESQSSLNEALLLHEQGQYDRAIEIYLEILKTNPNIIEVIHEIAYSYYSNQNYEKCLNYSILGLEYKSVYESMFCGLAGNSLDILDRPNDAIKVYQRGIESNQDDFMNYYNLALVYDRLNNVEKAEENFVNAIKINPNHSSSHLALAEMKKKRNQQIPALLLNCRFLTLEPTSLRSEQAITNIDELMYWGVHTEDGKNINLNMAGLLNNDSPFRMLEFSFRMKMATSISKENENKSIVQSRVEELDFLITVIEEKDRTTSDFLADYLFSYFTALKKSNNVEPFVYYIHQSANNEEVDNWIIQNQDKINEFIKWNDDFF